MQGAIHYFIEKTTALQHHYEMYGASSQYWIYLWMAKAHMT